MIARSVVPRALVQCPLSSEPQQPYEDDIHLAATAVGAILLPLPFVVLLGLLALRAALLPIVQHRYRETVTPLRPVHVGMVEMVVATCVVGLAFVSPI